MPDLFWTLVSILAGVAVVALLLFVIVWTVLGIRRQLIEHRARIAGPSRFNPSTRYWREHSAVTIPQAEREPIRQAAGRILAGESIESIVPPPAP